MIDILNSIKENYKSKIKNPLIGTYLGVWVIHNWVIVYSVFNFDKDFTMQDKINWIQGYFSKLNLIKEFLVITLYTLLVIFVTFIALAISRFLVNSYYDIVEKKITTWIDKNRIFIDTDREILEIEITGLNKKLSDIRLLKSENETQNKTDIDNYKNKIIDLNKTNEIIKNKSIENEKLISHLEQRTKINSVLKPIFEILTKKFGSLHIEAFIKHLQKHSQGEVDKLSIEENFGNQYIKIESFFEEYGFIFRSKKTNKTYLSSELIVKYYEYYTEHETKG